MVIAEMVAKLDASYNLPNLPDNIADWDVNGTIEIHAGSAEEMEPTTK